MRRPPLVVIHSALHAAIHAAAALAVLCLAGAPAWAHLKFNPLETARYVKVELGPERVRLAYSVGPGERPALRLLTAADTDRDGVLSAEERAALLDAEAARVAAGLVLSLDGVAIRPAFAERHIGLSEPPRVAAAPFAIDLVEVLPLGPPPEGGGPRRLVIDDSTAYPDPGEVEIRVEEAAGVELVGTLVAGIAAPSPRSVTFATVATPGERRDVAIEFRAPGRAGGWAAPGFNPVAAAAAAGFAVALGALAWWRQRRRRGAKGAARDVLGS